MQKAPSGKDLGQKSLMNLQNVSKSVEKQGSAQGVAHTAKTAHAQGTPQQYLVMNSNKDGKNRDSSKRAKEEHGQSNGGPAGIGGYGAAGGAASAGLQEKRLSQQQAQQFVNNQ